MWAPWSDAIALCWLHLTQGSILDKMLSGCDLSLRPPAEALVLCQEPQATWYVHSVLQGPELWRKGALRRWFCRCPVYQG